MQVELSEIVKEYKVLLAEAHHETLCYRLALKKSEDEVSRLQERITLLESVDNED